MKEIIEVENCKNYEVFHLVLTYMYTGKISLDKHTVADILEIASGYAVGKLKSYCSEFLERYYLSPKNCLIAVELSAKHHLTDLKKQALKFIHKNFKSVLKYHDIERMSLTKLQEYLNQSYWLPAEIVLKIIIRWIYHDQEKRAENFLQLYHNVNEQALSQVTNHLDKEEKAIYQGLQDKFLPDYQEIEQELEDNTSFLSIAFSAVKDLENQEVDETFSSYITFPESLTESQYQYRAPASDYKPGLESSGAESGLLVMGTKEEPGESGAAENDKNIGPMENATFLHTEADMKVPARIIPEPDGSSAGTGYTGLDQSGSMMFPPPRMMITPHNSAASSPVPSPVSISSKYRDAHVPVCAADQDLNMAAVASFQKPQIMSQDYYKPPSGPPDGESEQDVGHLEEMYHHHHHHSQTLASGSGQIYRDERSLDYGRFVYGNDLDRSVYPAAAIETYRQSQSNTTCVQNYDPYRIQQESDTEAMMQRQNDFGQQPYREVGMIHEDKTFPNSDPQHNRIFTEVPIDDYRLIQQFINEEEERTNYSATKRYDPKHRALAQAFRKKDISQQDIENNYIPYNRQPVLDPCSGSSKSEQLEFDQHLEEESEHASPDSDPGPSQYRQSCQHVSPPPLLPREQNPAPICSPVSKILPDDPDQEEEPPLKIDEGVPEDEDRITVLKSPCHSQQGSSSLANLSSCIQETLQTPEKSDQIQNNEDPDRNSSRRHSKLEPQQLFLTPKEKYAKEVSAQNQAPQISLNFNDVEPEVGEENVECQDKSDSKYTHTTNKSVFPSALKIFKSKKKMASQKRLILEHGEVRLSQRQHLRIRIKKPRKLRAKDIFQPSQIEEESRDVKPVEDLADNDSQNADDIPKKIINRKDKLLAEHRAEHQALNEAEETAKKNTFKCEKCSFSASTSGKLRAHEKIHEGDKTFLCPFCNHTSFWIKDHYKHVQLKHISGPSPFKCPRCSYQNTRLKQVLAHQTCHSDKLPFSCDVEGCTFKTKSLPNLKKHEKIHTEQKFNCPICDKSFGHKYTMEQHKAVHSNEKKYKCSVCTYSTKYSSHMAAHRRVHDGRVHRCTFDGCQYWTPKGTLLKAHIRAHNGEKCFKCETCGKGFVEAGQLKRHQKIHSTEKPFKCDIDNCTYSTNRRDKLKEHQGRSHKPKESLEPIKTNIKKRPSKIIFNIPPADSPESSVTLLDFSQM